MQLNGAQIPPEAILHWLFTEMKFQQAESDNKEHGPPKATTIRFLMRGNMTPVWHYLLRHVKNEEVVSTVRKNLALHLRESLPVSSISVIKDKPHSTKQQSEYNHALHEYQGQLSESNSVAHHLALPCTPQSQGSRFWIKTPQQGAELRSRGSGAQHDGERSEFESWLFSLGLHRSMNSKQHKLLSLKRDAAKARSDVQLLQSEVVKLERSLEHKSQAQEKIEHGILGIPTCLPCALHGSCLVAVYNHGSAALVQRSRLVASYLRRLREHARRCRDTLDKRNRAHGSTALFVGLAAGRVSSSSGEVEASEEQHTVVHMWQLVCHALQHAWHNAQLAQNREASVLHLFWQSAMAGCIQDHNRRLKGNKQQQQQQEEVEVEDDCASGWLHPFSPALAPVLCVRALCVASEGLLEDVRGAGRHGDSGEHKQAQVGTAAGCAQADTGSTSAGSRLVLDKLMRGRQRSHALSVAQGEAVRAQAGRAAAQLAHILQQQQQNGHGQRASAGEGSETSEEASLLLLRGVAGRQASHAVLARKLKQLRLRCEDARVLQAELATKWRALQQGDAQLHSLATTASSVRTAVQEAMQAWSSSSSGGVIRMATSAQPVSQAVTAWQRSVGPTLCCCVDQLTQQLQSRGQTEAEKGWVENEPHVHPSTQATWLDSLPYTLPLVMRELKVSRELIAQCQVERAQWAQFCHEWDRRLDTCQAQVAQHEWQISNQWIKQVQAGQQQVHTACSKEAQATQQMLDEFWDQPGGYIFNDM